MTKSWLGTGMWYGIIFLLVVSPSFRDLQSVEMHGTLGAMLLEVWGTLSRAIPAPCCSLSPSLHQGHRLRLEA